MKKLLATIVLGLLWSGNAYAVKYKSIFNFYIDIPEEYYLSSSLSPEKILEYSPNEEDRKELIAFSQRSTGLDIEVIFTKEKMLKQYKNIGGATSENIAILEIKKIKWDKNWKKNCNTMKKVNEIVSKQLKEPRRSFNCEYSPHGIAGQAFKNSSIFYQYIDLNAKNKVHSFFMFRHPVSKKIIEIGLTCEKNCKEMGPVFQNMIGLITLNNYK